MAVRGVLRSLKAGYVPVNWKLHGNADAGEPYNLRPFQHVLKPGCHADARLLCVLRSGCELNAKGIPLVKSTWRRTHDPATLNQSASRASCLPGGTEKPISGNAGGLFCAQNLTTTTMLTLNPSSHLMAEIKSQTVRPFVPAVVKR